MGEPETTVPATPLVLSVAGIAVDDVPVAVLDALEEDLESTVAVSPVVPSGISQEVAPTLPATSDQLRAIRVVAMDDTDTLVSADSRREHDMEATLEGRDPELRDVDEFYAPPSGDSSVDTESMDGWEESVVSDYHVLQVDLEVPLPRGAAVRDTLISLDEVDPCRMFEQREHQ